MEGCFPCFCGSKKLISDISIKKEKIVMKIKCIDCGHEGTSGENTREAIFLWNKRICDGRQ